MFDFNWYKFLNLCCSIGYLCEWVQDQELDSVNSLFKLLCSVQIFVGVGDKMCWKLSRNGIFNGIFTYQKKDLKRSYSFGISLEGYLEREGIFKGSFILFGK